jgi:hypothetical protein
VLARLRGQWRLQGKNGVNVLLFLIGHPLTFDVPRIIAAPPFSLLQ